MSTKTVFVVEDEIDIQEIISHNLKREGFKVKAFGDGVSALLTIKSKNPNLVILDLMLPGMDGLEVCRGLKADPISNTIPIIMLTAKGEESDIVLGLGMGADDYVSKPFSPKELVARVKAVLRRKDSDKSQSSSKKIVREGLDIDIDRHQVKIDGKKVEFTATEFRLLHFLASNPGRVFTRDSLMTRVLGEDAIVIDRNIDVHIQMARKKLVNYKGLIETVRGVGYRFKDVD